MQDDHLPDDDNDNNDKYFENLDPSERPGPPPANSNTKNAEDVHLHPHINGK